MEISIECLLHGLSIYLKRKEFTCCLYNSDTFMTLFKLQLTCKAAYIQIPTTAFIWFRHKKTQEEIDSVKKAFNAKSLNYMFSNIYVGNIK